MADVTEVKNERCPRCGSTLITNGDRVWCTFVGGRNDDGTSLPGCSYGIDTVVVQKVGT